MFNAYTYHDLFFENIKYDYAMGFYQYQIV